MLLSRRIWTVLAVLLAAASVIVSSPSQAGAVNRCGSWQAGEATTVLTYPGRSVLVQGDMWSTPAGSSANRWVAPGRDANYYGICDADKSWVRVNGSYRWDAISYGHLYCSQIHYNVDHNCTWAPS